MNYTQWLGLVPGSITGDPLWQMKVYRLALFTADLGWRDATKLISDRRTVGLSDQLYRAVGSVGANFSEGYSGSSGKDRARFYEYALGSARETRGWYFDGRHILGLEVAQHRMNLLTHVIKLLLTIIPSERDYSLKEESGSSTPFHAEAKAKGTMPDLEDLLTTIPFP